MLFIFKAIDLRGTSLLRIPFQNVFSQENIFGEKRSNFLLIELNTKTLASDDVEILLHCVEIRSHILYLATCILLACNYSSASLHLTMKIGSTKKA
jgi:hypothetical protein